MLGWFGRWKNSFTEDKARICLLIASYRCIIYFSRFIRQTLLASRAWIVGTVQIFLCDNTISDMMIHLFQNIRVSKSYQGALFCVLFCSFINYHRETFTCELMYSYEYFYYDENKLKSAVNWVFSAPVYKRQQVCIFFLVCLTNYSKTFR